MIPVHSAENVGHVQTLKVWPFGGKLYNTKYLLNGTPEALLAFSERRLENIGIHSLVSFTML